MLFSGGLYLLALTGLGQIAWIVPVGGATFVVGWGARLGRRARPRLTGRRPRPLSIASPKLPASL
ncbi:MAG: hypothetical protein V3U44_02745 [Alphaproteobacteria bacterium]